MNTLTPPPRKWSYSLGTGGLIALCLVAISLLVICLAPADKAYATETVVKVSNAQTEPYDTSVYLTDKNTSWPTVESVPSGWSSAADPNSSSGYRKMVYYSKGSYWISGSATIKVRYDKVAKIDGKWVSARYTFNNLKGDGIATWNGGWWLPNGSEGSGIQLYDFWSGFLYFGLYSVDCQMELFYTDSGSNISMSGGYVTFGSLNYDPNVADNKEGVKYVSSNNFKSYVLATNNLSHSSDGTWMGRVADSTWKDVIGSDGYNKYSVCFGIVDTKPKFRVSSNGTTKTNCSWVTINPNPLTIATPESPSKTATIGSGETSGNKALEDGTYVIYNCYATGKVMDVTAGGTSNGTKIQSYDYNGSNAQKWKITTDEYGISTIIGVGSGKALDLTGGSTTTGNQLQIYGSGTSKNQKWKIVPWGDGYKILWAGDTSKAIDLTSGWTDNGVAIVICSSNDTAWQQWRFVKVG